MKQAFEFLMAAIKAGFPQAYMEYATGAHAATAAAWISGELSPVPEAVALAAVRFLRSVDPQLVLRMNGGRDYKFSRREAEILKRADVHACRIAMGRCDLIASDLGGGDYPVSKEAFWAAMLALFRYGDGEISAAKLAAIMRPIEAAYLSRQLEIPGVCREDEALRAVLCAARGMLWDCAFSLTRGATIEPDEVCRATEPLVRASGYMARWEAKRGGTAA